MTRPRRLRSTRRQWVGRLALLATGVTLIMAGGGLGSAAVAAAPLQSGLTGEPMTASLSAVPATTTRAPFGEYVTRLSFDVAAIEPALVTAAGPSVPRPHKMPLLRQPFTGASSLATLTL